MNLLKSIVLGIVEGITEWLPISSTAHLNIFKQILNFDVTPEYYEVFKVVIQLGAAVALFIVLFKKIWPFGQSKSPLGKGVLSYVKKDKFILWLKIAVSCIPVIIYELFLDNYVNFINEKNEMLFIAIALIVVGIVFVVVEYLIKDKKPIVTATKEMTFTYALIIGLVQLIAAVFPGVSRSGATIIASLLLGVSRSTAVEYTYELAIPVMLGASFMKLLGYGKLLELSNLLMLLVACTFAFIVSLFVIRFVLSFIRKNNFVIFGIYRVILGIIIIIFLI